MKYYIFITSVLILIGVISSCDREAQVPQPVLDVIPKEYNINDPLFVHAKREAMELIEDCGIGVIDGAKGENRCSFTVKMGSRFFTHPSDKTGLRKDERGFYESSPVFFRASQREIPDNFNILHLIEAEKPTPGDQGSCGSCWGYSTNQGLEIIRGLKDKKLFKLSAQTMLSCSGYGSCNGGSMEAPNFLLHGLPLELDFPYKAKDLKCKYSKSEIETGWEGKAIEAPWVGASLERSRFWIGRELREDAFKKVSDIKSAMLALQSPAIATVSAYSLNNGVYDVCSKGAWTDHMVVITGFEKWKEKQVAHVYNSWGKDFGDNGIGKQVWACPDGTLVRRLGEEARVINYKPECAPPQNPNLKPVEMVFLGSKVVLGKDIPNVKCSWLPKDGLENPASCATAATPNKSTEYHVTIENECGITSAMTLIKVYGPLKDRSGLFQASKTILTPHGETNDPGY